MTDPEKVKVGNKEEVYLALAEEMRKCWSMFGEGDLQYVGDDILGGIYIALFVLRLLLMIALKK